MSGVDNVISDRSSHSHDITVASLLSHMKKTFPQRLPWRMWNPPSSLVSAIASTLRRTTSPRTYLRVDPPSKMVTGKSVPHSSGTWPSTPYSYHTRTQSPSSLPSQVKTVLGQFPQAAVKYDSAWLRMPYGRFSGRSPIWGPEIPTSQAKGNYTSDSTSSSGATPIRTHHQVE